MSFSFAKKKKIIVGWKERASDEEYVALPQSHIIQTHQGQVFCKSSLHQVYFPVFRLLSHCFFYFLPTFCLFHTHTHLLFHSFSPSFLALLSDSAWSWSHQSLYENLQSGTALNVRDDSSTTLMAVNFSRSNKAPEETTKNKHSVSRTTATLYLWDIN